LITRKSVDTRWQDSGHRPDDALRLAERRALVQRRHRRARWHASLWLLPLVLLAAWLTALIAAFIVVR
jgi:hypothetical protein